MPKLNHYHNFARRWPMAVIALAIASLMASGCGQRQEKPPANADLSQALNPGADFTLHDQRGKVFHLKDHRGQVVLLFFGYTACPDECPLTLSKLARVYRLLGPAWRQKVLTVFVTVDPLRDTPQKLKEYLSYFDINAVGLTGTKAEIDKVVASYKATYVKVHTNSAMGDMYDHSDYLYLIGPDGKTRRLFHLDDKPSDIAQTIKGT